jgi:hypothetical protein
MHAYLVRGAQHAHAAQIAVFPVQGIGSSVTGNRKAIVNPLRWLLSLHLAPVVLDTFNLKLICRKHRFALSFVPLHRTFFLFLQERPGGPSPAPIIALVYIVSPALDPIVCDGLRP